MCDRSERLTPVSHRFGPEEPVGPSVWSAVPQCNMAPLSGDALYRSNSGKAGVLAKREGEGPESRSRLTMPSGAVRHTRANFVHTAHGTTRPARTFCIRTRKLTFAPVRYSNIVLFPLVCELLSLLPHLLACWPFGPIPPYSDSLPKPSAPVCHISCQRIEDQSQSRSSYIRMHYVPHCSASRSSLRNR